METKTVRATEAEHELIYFIRGAKLAPERAVQHIIAGLYKDLENAPAVEPPAAAPAAAPAVEPPAAAPAAEAQAKPKKRERVDNYKMLRDSGVPVPEARKYRYSPPEKIVEIMDKYAPAPKEPAQSKDKSPAPKKRKKS